MTMYDVCQFTAKRILRPSLKLIGAKTKIRDLLYIHFPLHDIYYEPFCGTGGVLIGKKWAIQENVGDLNEYLINYYRTIKMRPGEFFEAMSHLHQILVSVGEPFFEELKQIVIHAEDDRILQAVCFYLITKHCFNGIWRLNEKGKVNSSWGGKTDGRGIFTEYWLKLVSERVKGILFEVCDYKRMLRRAANLYEPEIVKNKRTVNALRTFVFLDPPYHDCSTRYNGEFFSDHDFRELADLLRDAPYKWLLTINDDAFIRDLFQDYDMISHDVFYSCNVNGAERKKQPELLIANYPLTRTPPNMQLSLNLFNQ